MEPSFTTNDSHNMEPSFNADDSHHMERSSDFVAVDCGFMDEGNGSWVMENGSSILRPVSPFSSYRSEDHFPRPSSHAGSRDRDGSPHENTSSTLIMENTANEEPEESGGQVSADPLATCDPLTSPEPHASTDPLRASDLSHPVQEGLRRPMSQMPQKQGRHAGMQLLAKRMTNERLRQAELIKRKNYHGVFEKIATN